MAEPATWLPDCPCSLFRQLSFWRASRTSASARRPATASAACPHRPQVQMWWRGTAPGAIPDSAPLADFGTCRSGASHLSVKGLSGFIVRFVPERPKAGKDGRERCLPHEAARLEGDLVKAYQVAQS